jgi:hypothetical protein
VTEKTAKTLLCCGFGHIGKAMGQVYQCCWRIYGEMFFQVRISHVLSFVSICDLFTDSLSYFILACLTVELYTSDSLMSTNCK